MMGFKQAWLNLVSEEIIDPERPIVDPHHHLWRQRSQFPSYLLDHLWTDTGSGHRVDRTVFVECGAEYLRDGPVPLRPVGETEFVTALAEQTQASKNSAKICGIVAHADLSLGNAVEEVLVAQIEAGRGLVRGIRHHAVWDASTEVPKSRINPPGDLYQQPGFRSGMTCLGRMGLSYDSWIYHPQIAQLTELARACPDTSIILNHLGTPIGVGPYKGRRSEILEIWKRSMAELSRCPNVTVKLGGLAMLVNGYDWHQREQPPNSDEIAETQKPYHLYAIDCFGPVLDDNYPVRSGDNYLDRLSTNGR